MKKFLAVLAIAGTLVACNNEGEGTDTTDSLNIVDTTTITPLPNPDTTTILVDTTGGSVDTTTRP